MKNKKDETKKVINFHLRSKLLLIFIPLVIITLSLTILIVERQMRTSIQEEFVNRGTSIGKNLAAGNANYVVTYNYVALDQIVEKTVRENNLSYAMIRLFDGEIASYSGDLKFKAELKKSAPDLDELKQEGVVADFKNLGQNRETILTVETPIVVQDRIWGEVSIGMSFKNISDSIQKTRFLLICLGLVIALFSCIISMLLSNRITRHLSLLVNDVEEVSLGHYDKKIEINTKDEIGYLAKRFSVMKESLRNHVDLLKHSNTELERTNNKLHNLFLTTQSMNPIEDRKTLCNVILDSAMKAVEPEGASLLIVKPDNTIEVAALKLRKDIDTENHDIINQFLELNSFVNPTNYLLGDKIGSFQVQFECANSTPMAKIKLADCSEYEMVSIPLQQNETLIGLINIVLEKDKLLHPADIEAINVLANHISITLKRNALHFELEDAYLSSIQSLAKTLEFKDEYTHGHAERVAEMCLRIGEKMGVDPETLKTLHIAALLHDIGKIGVMDNVLNKKSKLNDNEWDLIKRHPVFGDEILSSITFLKDARTIVRHHHEREDGKGYPDRLSGNELSLSEKIIIVADSFDAMNSKRSYRDVMGTAYIRDEFLKNKGKQFDPNVVEVFLEILDDMQDEFLEEKNESKLIVFPNRMAN